MDRHVERFLEILTAIGEGCPLTRRALARRLGVVRGPTSIVITRRLATILRADKIVVMARGGVEAVGRHAALLVSSETYGRLYCLQFAEEESLGRL